MRVFAFIAAAVTWMVMAGCAARSSNPVMSTEGTILVRNGTVTGVRDIGAAAKDYAGSRTGQAANASTTSQVTVRLESGEQQVYHVAPGESFKVGESVRILNGNSGARITH